MSFVCLSIPGWPTAGARGDEVGALLAITPHVLADARGLIWLDARGLPPRRLARGAIEIARRHGHDAARAAAARTAIAAEVGTSVVGGKRAGLRPALTRASGPQDIVVVRPGFDARFLAPHPITVLAPAHGTSPHLAAALADVGIAHCGDLARLDRESVEVRFGPEGVSLWRLARADDDRRIFGSTPRALPSASVAWEEYALRDTERLLFVANRLVASVCAELRSWGEAAREMTMTLSLVDRTTAERPLRAARPSAGRTAWLRLVRADLERTSLPAAVVGLALRVETVSGGQSPQGDLFDRGFQTQRAVEEALDDIVGARCAVRGARELPRDPFITHVTALRRPPAPGTRHPAPAFALQLLPVPRRVTVATVERRGHRAPVRYRDPTLPAETAITTAAGPDRVSGGDEVGAPYAREYFHCQTSDGLLVLLYRDALADAWYVHGWWD